MIAAICSCWAGPSPLPVGAPEVAPPTAPCASCPLQQALRDAQWQAGFYRALHQRACQREQRLQQQVAELQATVRDLRHRLFGESTERHASLRSRYADGPAARRGLPSEQPPRRRGQQPGAQGHGRRSYVHLPTTEEWQDLPRDQCRCRRCGQPFAPFPGTDDATVLEVEVRAHRRLIHRRRYRPTCTCGAHPGIVTAPPPPRLIAKSPFGVSVWISVLLDKYLFYRPTARLLADLRSHGLDLSQGALTGGLRHLLPLFEPVYDALVEHNQRQPSWHGDETHWQVFATIEGKVGYRWYLWVFYTAEAVVFVLAAGRGHDVPEEHFGPVAGGILVADRFQAYRAIDKVKAGQIVLAFCWAHVRRDFREVGRGWEAQRDWAGAWVERIGELYHLNTRRLALREDSEGFAQRDGDLRAAVDRMATQATAELAEPTLHPARRKVLASLGDHWTGLTVFVEHPEVPMDNNAAERAERGPVVGRKNYYGSGAVWAGRLTAMLFSVFQTLPLWGLNPRAWLTWYLTACADNGGRAPADVSAYLPWNLSADQRQRLGSSAGPAPPAGPGRDTS